MSSNNKIRLKSKLIPTTLWLLIIIWLVLIFFLSSQSGVQTAKVSGEVAQSVAEIIYKQPTNEQVNQVHLNIRTIAHIVLFFVLGILSYTALKTTFRNKNKQWLVWLISLAICLGYSYYDEWHKQFIAGRHFQINEAVINMLCSIVGILTAFAVFLLVAKIKKIRSAK